MERQLSQKTKGQIKREKRDAELYAKYVEFASIPGQSKTELTQYLMDKYNIDSPSTIYTIIKRVEAQRKEVHNEQDA